MHCVQKTGSGLLYTINKLYTIYSSASVILNACKLVNSLLGFLNLFTTMNAVNGLKRDLMLAYMLHSPSVADRERFNALYTRALTTQPKTLSLSQERITNCNLNRNGATNLCINCASKLKDNVSNQPAKANMEKGSEDITLENDNEGRDLSGVVDHNGDLNAPEVDGKHLDQNQNENGVTGKDERTKERSKDTFLSTASLSLRASCENVCPTDSSGITVRSMDHLNLDIDTETGSAEMNRAYSSEGLLNLQREIIGPETTDFVSLGKANAQAGFLQIESVQNSAYTKSLTDVRGSPRSNKVHPGCADMAQGKPASVSRLAHAVSEGDLCRVISVYIPGEGEFLSRSTEDLSPVPAENRSGFDNTEETMAAGDETHMEGSAGEGVAKIPETPLETQGVIMEDFMRIIEFNTMLSPQMREPEPVFDDTRNGSELATKMRLMEALSEPIDENVDEDSDAAEDPDAKSGSLDDVNSGANIDEMIPGSARLTMDTTDLDTSTKRVKGTVKVKSTAPPPATKTNQPNKTCKTKRQAVVKTDKKGVLTPPSREESDKKDAECEALINSAASCKQDTSRDSGESARDSEEAPRGAQATVTFKLDEEFLRDIADGERTENNDKGPSKDGENDYTSKEPSKNKEDKTDKKKVEEMEEEEYDDEEEKEQVEFIKKHKRLHEEKENKEKERSLQRKVTDLSSTVQRLEKRVTLLKGENDALKKKTEDQKPAEEKIKKLKKRNAELAAIARRLEEKAKQLQQENSKRRESTSPNVAENDTTRRRSLRSSRHADEQKVLAKEKELENLREKCQQLTEQLISSSRTYEVQGQEAFEGKDELQNIIKQEALERLKLESKIVKLNQNSEAELSRVRTLEDNNKALREQVDKLIKAADDTEKLEIEVTQRKIECENLNKDVESSRQRCRKLETELQEVIEKNTQLTVQNSDLQQRINDLEKVNEECKQLRSQLAEVESECTNAKSQVKSLTSQISSLQAEIKKLKHEAEKSRDYEKKHKESVKKLKSKEEEIRMLKQDALSAEQQHVGAMSGLQSKLQELEKRYELQQVKHDELTLEMDHLRLEAERARQRPLTETAHSQTDTPRRPSPQPISVRAGLSNDLASSYDFDAMEAQEPVDLGDIEIVNKRELEEAIVGESYSTNENTESNELSTGEIQNQAAGEETVPRVLDEHALQDVHDNGIFQQYTQDSGNFHEFSESGGNFQYYDANQDLRDDVEVEGQNGLPVLSPNGDRMENEDNNNKIIERSHDVLTSNVTNSAYLKNSPFQVYIAKYTYDPVEYSPNENPESELSLNAGEYIFVYGEMDEDGFLEGELMDGRRGLVPSNFVEKVPDEELEEFHQTVGLRAEEGGSGASQDYDFNSSDENPEKFAMEHLKQDGSRTNKLLEQVDLEEIQEVEESSSLPIDKPQNFTVAEVPYSGVPPPRGLKVERQLHNSVLISWSPPMNLSANEINSYHVFLDGQFKTSVSGTERTKALIEGLDLLKPHQLSVRTITNRGHSDDALQVITIGKGLPPDTSYKVLVTTRVDDATVAVHKASSVQFHTLEGGIPDAPLDIQVEVGPQEGSLLVTWLPVTITNSGKSNGAVVTGYTVYVDGERVRELNSPTGDHVILEMKDFARLTHSPQRLTVRTTAKDDTESPDSNPTVLTPPLLSEIRRGVSQNKAKGVTQVREEAEITSEQDSEAINDLPPLNNVTDDVKADLEHVTMPQPIETETRAGVHFVAAQPVITPAPAKKTPPVANTKPLEEELLDVENQEVDLPEGIEEQDDSELSDIQEVSEEEVKDKSPTDAARAQVKSSRKQTDSVGRKSSSPRRQGGHVSPRQDSGHVSPAYHPDSTPPRHIKHPQGSVPEKSPRMVPTRFVKDGHMAAPQVMFRPVREDDYDDRGSISPRYHGSSAGPVKPQPRMQVPHIQITKDSSGSGISGEEMTSGGSVQQGRSQSPHDKRWAVKADRPKNSMDTQRRPKSVPNSQRGQEADVNDMGQRRGHSAEGTRVPNGRPKSAKSSRVGDNRRGSNTGNRLEDESYGSYSALEDNNKVTTHKIRDDLTMSELIDYEDDGGDSLIDSVPEMDVYDDDRVRIFIALFDYDPYVMSPNPDVADEELPFKEGQLIKIYGEKDPDGFFAGEANGRRGLVPCNMVSEVQVDDPEIADQLLKESNRAVSSARMSSRNTSRNDSRGASSRGPSRGDMPRQNGLGPRVQRSPRRSSRESSPGGIPYPPSGPRKRMIAMYDYDPQELSPNVDVEMELPFKAGQDIVVFGEMDEDGFFFAEINGRRGLVPSNFLQEAPPIAHEHRTDRHNGPHAGPPRGYMAPLHRGPGSYGPPHGPHSPAHDPRDTRSDPRVQDPRAVQGRPRSREYAPPGQPTHPNITRVGDNRMIDNRGPRTHSPQQRIPSHERMRDGEKYTSRSPDSMSGGKAEQVRQNERPKAAKPANRQRRP